MFALQLPVLSYCTWLASIGEDYGGCVHILRLNKVFHDAQELHDGDEARHLPRTLSCSITATVSPVIAGTHGA